MSDTEKNLQAKVNISVPDEAIPVHREIVKRLKLLEGGNFNSCLDSGFISLLNGVYELFQIFQKTVLEKSSINCCCSVSCAMCCNHWVEDVNSFEAEIIADYIRKNRPRDIEKIINTCMDDCKELERLDNLVQNQLSLIDQKKERIDEIDLLLSVYYQMKRPCPLLDHNSRCSVYPVRPFTCRIYVNLSDPSGCSPEDINDGEVKTYLLDLEENANEILDRLHFRFMKYEGDTGLRSLLPKYLEGLCI